MEGPDTMRIAGMDIFAGEGAASTAMRDAGMSAVRFEILDDPAEDILLPSGQQRRGLG